MKFRKMKTSNTPATPNAQAPTDTDAVKIGDLYRKARESIVASIRHLIEAGQILAAKKASLKHGDWLPWLAENADTLGFDTDRTAQRLIKIAAKFDASAGFGETEALQISRQVWGHSPRGTFGTGENEWHTPPEYIEMAREVLGAIDLDPASTHEAQAVVNAGRYFTSQENGLDQKWHGRVWLNPPYAQPLIANFVAKLIAENEAERVTAAIMLTHNYTDTAWFQNAAATARAICFPRGRIRFVSPEGELAAPTQGQAFFYFGANNAAFARVFSQIGFITPLDAWVRAC